MAEDIDHLVFEVPAAIFSSSSAIHSSAALYPSEYRCSRTSGGAGVSTQESNLGIEKEESFSQMLGGLRSIEDVKGDTRISPIGGM